MPLRAPVVNVWTMRDAIVRAGIGSCADSQSLSPYDLEDIWRELWETQRADCLAAIKAFRLGALRHD